jgi:hypothetical protein
MRLCGGKFGIAYRCTVGGCRGSHGAHPDGSPLGEPADIRTKKARIEAHDAFDRLWRHGPLTRSGAYRWMAEILGISKKAAHIGKLSHDSCTKLVGAVRKEFPDLFPFDP